jgi:hypothetical protein
VAPQRNWFIYRVPSVVAGTGTVALAAQIARRWGSFATVVAASLTGTSFVLIFYASEARGYALSGFFALAAFLALDRYLATRSIWANAQFALTTVLGTLAHLTFVQFYVGAVAWSGVSCAKNAPTWRQACVWLAQVHAVPACFLVALYVIDVRAMSFGGGDSYVLRDVLTNSCALAVGVFGERPALLMAGGLLAVIAAVAALVCLWREKFDLWAFLVAGFIVTPLLLLAFRPPPVLHERYFYLNILFFLILLSYFFGRVARWGRVGQCAAALAFTLFVAANVTLTCRFLQVGRGHFLEALVYMAQNSSGTDIHVSGDAEFAYRLYTEFYSPYVPAGHRFFVDRLAPDMRVEPEWIILNSQAQPYSPKRAIHDTKTGREIYVLARVFPYAGLSGTHFAVYHRVANQGGENGHDP